MVIPEEVLTYDPMLIALCYDVSIEEVRKTFWSYSKKYGNILSRKETYELTDLYVSKYKKSMKKMTL